jgi:NAD(P)-dependent dehydrogenase (short-subunit alcohol dehydrogenase family)
MHPLFDLTGRVAIVTGAAQNMGRSSALGLAEAGADLIVADINGPGVEATAAEIRGLGRRALAHVVDLNDETQIRAVFGVWTMRLAVST